MQTNEAPTGPRYAPNYRSITYDKGGVDLQLSCPIGDWRAGDPPPTTLDAYSWTSPPDLDTVSDWLVTVIGYRPVAPELTILDHLGWLTCDRWEAVKK